MPRLLPLLLITALASTAHAEPRTWSLEGVAVEFEVPLTIGSHDGTIGDVQGSLTVDPTNLAATTGTLVAPIATFDTGNDKRDCHLRESLGIDYASSSFPDKHVCDGATVPAGEIKYPNVEFVIDGLRHAGGNLWYVDGSVNLHGVPRSIGGSDVSLTIRVDGADQVSVEGRWTVSLDAHDVIVKNVPFIKVKDTIEVRVDGQLTPQ